MKFELGHVSVKHLRGDLDPKLPVTGTTVIVTIDGAEKRGACTIHGSAICHPNDHFSKKEGRLVAAERVLSRMRGLGFSKEERRTVFWAICPQFKPKPKKEES